MLNKTLINILSNISLKEVSIEEIFEETIGGDGLSFTDSEQKPLQKMIYFSQLESAMNTTMDIRNPITNDLEQPQDDFKDSFLLKHEYIFKEPLLIQSMGKAVFSQSHYVYFYDMPFFYPVKEEGKKNVFIKVLNNEIIFRKKINLREDIYFKSFVEKYLSTALKKGNSHLNFQIEIINNYSKKQASSDYYDINMINETFDFIEEVFENSRDNKIKNDNLQTIVSIKQGRSSNVFDYDELMERTKYKELRKNEIQRELKINLKRGILCSGFIRFDTYREKLEFLNSGAGKFGIHLQGMKVIFQDSDFLNLLEMNYFAKDKNLKQIMEYINFKLRVSDIENIKFHLPNYVNDIFDLSQKVIDCSEDRIFMRFNSFEETLEAYNIMKTNLFNDVSQEIIFHLDN